MRYTTIIDISEAKDLYKSVSARLLYLHLVLKCGYHDDDRDRITYSVRNLAADLSMSVSAVRCAIKTLEKYQLLKHQGSVWYVRKFVLERAITPRAKTKKEREEQAIAAERERQQYEQDERMRRAKEAKGQKSGLMVLYEQRLKEAAAGDIEAIDYCKRKKAVYEEHLKKYLERQKNEKTS